MDNPQTLATLGTYIHKTRHWQHWAHTYTRLDTGNTGHIHTQDEDTGNTGHIHTQD